MDRRDFVKAGIAASALGPTSVTAHADDDRHYYELRLYETRSDMAPARLSSFFEKALIPALTQAGVAAVGAFWPDVGAINQQMVLLLDHRTASDALDLPARLNRDAAYSRALEALEGDAQAPYVRYESRLMRAFANHPKVEVPATPGSGRVFEMRTYESRNAATLARKIAMFNESEITLFRSLGMTPVFFGEDVFGSGLPSLTYMLAFDDLAARERAWRAFGGSAEWQRLSKDPRFTIEGITTTTRAMLLRALPYSQVR